MNANNNPNAEAEMTIKVLRGIVVDRIIVNGHLYAVIHETGQIIEEFGPNAPRRSAR